MTVETVIAIGRSALELTVALAGPVLLFGLVAGLGVSVFQALTQINEITLTFIPKIVATAAALALFGPWMLTRLITFTTTLFQSLPDYVR
ncbi:MAG: flagellar biosynthesis protein FliQ [Deltaproteobacteria bacterium]|nr:MAG: flagellar biosynthesis protein FliQ [Deltaproteobacteria bacterium]